MSDSNFTASNAARIQDVYGRYARGDRDAIFEALAPEVTWTSIGEELVPWAGVWQGAAGVKQYFSEIDAVAEVVGYELERVIAQGEWIAVLARATVRYRRDGQEHHYAKADFVRMVDGKLAEFREFYDTGRASRDYAGR